MVRRVQAIPYTLEAAEASPDASLHRRAIRLWLLAVAALVFATLLVGGATRLTESGLSIVEWKPVTGTVPPLSDNAWQTEFEKYQATTQYQQLNRGMTLPEFKTIYWWEWTHRLLGRLIGAAFLFPFVWFLWRGWVPRGLKLRLWGIFALGAAQGAVGWWMVASGLVGRVSVSQYRLAFHLTLACVIFTALVWTAQSLAPRAALTLPRRLRFEAGLLLALVLLQIYAGALVAGLDAGLSYNTWPLIDGGLVPTADRLWFVAPAWRNFFENGLMAQFNHRMIAYAICVFVVLHLIDVMRSRVPEAAKNGALLVACAVFVQASLGIVTLLHQAPLDLALTHQGMAILLLTLAVLHAQRMAGRPIA
jgi:cytochrome c oxidase assembly protein subunit 15